MSDLPIKRPYGRMAVLTLAALMLLSACGDPSRGTSAPQRPRAGEAAPDAPRSDVLRLIPSGFAELPGWVEDGHGEALFAFRRSCTRLLSLPPDRDIGTAAVPLRAADIREICREAEIVPDSERMAPRTFFERWFVPVLATDDGEPAGLFTGYYEPILRGCQIPRRGCDVPLYRRPSDLIEVDLGSFRDTLKGQRIAGRLDGNRLVPYADREAIDAGALRGRGLELAFVEDATEAFFLHVQGSGRVVFDDGRVLRVGFAGQNGHVYASIGRELVRRGEMTLDQASMQSIQAWVKANPARAAALFATNPSYVFFEPRDGEGPLGAQGVALVPGRSLAVDRRFVPLGLPLWLDAAYEQSPFRSGPPDRIRRLMVAQDTGGAIRGPVRGDFFWGAGPEAGAFAGRMKSRGSYWLLLPRPVAARALAGS